MATQVSVDLVVEGNPQGMTAVFSFQAVVSCIAPDTGQVYPPAAGEVKCKLVEVVPIWPDKTMEEKDCPAGGVCDFWVGAEISEYTEFKIEATHKQTGDMASAKVGCFPDGSWNRA